MKVHLIKRLTIADYTAQQARAIKPFNEWYFKMKIADWNKPEDIFSTFSSADLLGNGTDRVVFDIGGNKYRMICTYLFGREEVHLFVNWIGTHAEYSKLLEKNEQYTIRIYIISIWKQL